MHIVRSAGIQLDATNVNLHKAATNNAIVGEVSPRGWWGNLIDFQISMRRA